MPIKFFFLYFGEFGVLTATVTHVLVRVLNYVFKTSENMFLKGKSFKAKVSTLHLGAVQDRNCISA